MKAGIAIDSWKFQIFDRHLKQGGYSFGRVDGFIKGVIVLTVNTDNAEALEEVVKAANAEAAKTGAPQ